VAGTAEERRPVEQDKNWHLDKRVPIALIGVILAQTFAGGWWAATTGERLSALERDRTTSAIAVDTAAKSSSSLSERMVRIETKFDGVVDTLTEIKNILRQPPRSATP